MQHNRLSPLALALSLALSACQPPVVQSPRQNSFKTLSTQSKPFAKQTTRFTGAKEA